MLDIYVANTGLASNTGTSPTSPVPTLAEAYKRLSPFIIDSVTIHLADPTPWEILPAFVQLNSTAQITIIGDGAGQVGDDGFTVVATGTVAAGTTAASIVPSAAIAVDAYQGYTIEITSGPAAGSRRSVRNNTAGAIIPVAAFGSVPVVGNTFRIVVPNVVLDVSSNDVLATAGRTVYGPALNLINLNLTGSGGSFTFRGANVRMWGVQVVNAWPKFTQTSVTAGATYWLGDVSTAFWSTINQPNNDVLWAGWGLQMPTSFIDQNTTYTNFNARFAGFVVCDYIYASFFMQLGGGFSHQVATSSQNADGLSFDTIPGGYGYSSVEFLNRAVTNGTAMYMESGSITCNQGISIDASASGAYGVLFTNDSTLYAAYNGTFITADGLAIYGGSTTGGKVILATPDAGAMTITSTANRCVTAVGMQFLLQPGFGSGNGTFNFNANVNGPGLDFYYTSMFGNGGNHNVNVANPNVGAAACAMRLRGSNIRPDANVTATSAGSLAAIYMLYGSTLEIDGFTLSGTCTGSGPGIELRGGSALEGTVASATFSGGTSGINCLGSAILLNAGDVSATANTAGGSGLIVDQASRVAIAATMTCVGTVGAQGALIQNNSSCYFGELKNTVGGIGALVQLGALCTAAKTTLVGTTGAGLRVNTGALFTIGTTAGSTITGQVNGIDAQSGGIVNIAQMSVLTVTATTGSQVIVGGGAGESGTTAGVLGAANTSIQNTTSTKGGSIIQRAA